LGGFGRGNLGTADWVENLDRDSRICAGASPPPLVVAAASTSALEVARTTPELREQLWANVARARNGLRSLGWEMADTPVPILMPRKPPGKSAWSASKQAYSHGRLQWNWYVLIQVPQPAAHADCHFANSFQRTDRSPG